MRVLHVTEACGAGVGRHLELILPRLVGRGVSCGLLAFGNRFEAGFREKIEGLGLEWHQLVPIPGNRLLNLHRYISCIREACQKWAPEVVHLHAFVAGLAGRLTHLPHSPRIVYSPHAFGFHKPNGFFRRIAVKNVERLLCRRTDVFALVGPSEMEDARAIGAKEGKLLLALNGIPDIPFLPRNEARRALGIPLDCLVGVVPCRLEPQKGLVSLLKALALTTSPCQLHIFGDGSLKKKLSRLIVNLHLEEKAFIHPPQENLRELLKAFDFGVLPSRYEGLSYSLLEMLLADLPVIASDIPANRLAGLEEEICYVAPGDCVALARVLDEVKGCNKETHDAVLKLYPLERQVALVGMASLKGT